MYIWITLVGILILDRISKIIVQHYVPLGQSIVVIPHFFHITYILNPGAAFGILAGQNWFFISISILVIGAIIYFHKQVPVEQKLMSICMGLIGGGALGNFYDRLFVGKVVDFLDFKVWSYIFNIADSALVVGGLALALLIFLQDKKSKSVEK